LADAVPLQDMQESNRVALSAVSLREYGRSGAVVAQQIIGCLNLQACQESLLTTAATFAMLGGDSLSATRVVRAVYACHYKVQNNRFLGGRFGVLEGPFATIHLLTAENLGCYIDWLDKNGICSQKTYTEEVKQDASRQNVRNDCNQSDAAQHGSLLQVDMKATEASQLYEALLQATSFGDSTIAVALLNVGADPNLGKHGGRLGKISSRNERRQTFRSSPLHIACLKGIPRLVGSLLKNGAEWNSPDASGLFPLHLAAAGEYKENPSSEEDARRQICVKLLLDNGVPLTMKDGNKQTVLHAAARAGHCGTLRFVLQLWKEYSASAPEKRLGLDLLDLWSRTAGEFNLVRRFRKMHFTSLLTCGILFLVV
jgi:ankyrin repeat protein